MKKYSLLLCFISFFQIGYSQSDLQVKNLAAFCKVWGFLKYYHPAVSKSNIDWDTVLTNNYPKVKDSKTKEEFNHILLSIAQRLGELKTIKNSFNHPDSLAINADFKWMDDTTILSSLVCNYLQRVKKNHKPFKNKYVGTYFWEGTTEIKEKPYPEMVYPNEAYRFLSLARYWNIIDYYFPDKYLMDTNWNMSLERAIPIFINAPNQEEYYRAIEWITARTDDSHATFVEDPDKQSYLKYKVPPFAAFYHNDTLTIWYITSDYLANLFNIKKHDEIISINGKSIKALWQDVRAHHSASNESFAHFGFDNGIIVSENDSSILVILREGKIIRTTVRNYSGKELMAMIKYDYSTYQKNSFKIKTDSVSGKKFGYIYMGLLKRKEINRIFRQMKGIDYLVIDNRDYPSSNIHAKLGNKLVKGRKYIASYTQPDYRYPGYLKYYEHPEIAPFSSKVGSKKNYYKGKVIILVDHSTASSAEYLTMVLQLAPNDVVIGTQTAGADGDIATVAFPGNYSANFTGLGWFYADGRQTQRVGIVPDIKVNYTTPFRPNRNDPIMQRALEYIRNGK